MCGKHLFLNSESLINSFLCVLSTANIGHMAGGNSGDSCECSQAAISWPSAYSQLLRWTAVRSGAGGSAEQLSSGHREHSVELEYVIVGIP